VCRTHAPGHEFNSALFAAITCAFSKNTELISPVEISFCRRSKEGNQLHGKVGSEARHIGKI